ncbi:MAG TPA: ABC transporter ATP-binding protein, partial [Bacillota bacterium]|nr:ABC transporter ATP-binding protein [Bacillota bacterium]
LGEINGYVEEMVTGARVVKVFGREDEVCSAFDEKSRRLRDIAYKTELVSGMFMPAMHLLDNLGFAVVALVGALLAANGIIHLGIVASFIIYSRQFSQPIRDLSNQWNTFQSGLAGAERVFEIMDTESEVDAPGANDLRLPVLGSVEFEHVSFSYKPGVPVLADISLEAKPGQTIALVGATGSGKTTIISLLSRFYDIEEGHIFVDGVDIREIRRDSLRRALGIVLQDSQLFSGTVRENIRYGHPDASDADVEKAAELALADPFIRRMPEGYDSVLTADGGNLSQGQRQLICIARAVMADPAILILDEATSSVDTRTELQIQKAILQLMRGRTSFVIAHRLSTIQGADQILVIDHGRIVECGTHGELLARDGPYVRLHESQFHLAAQPAMGGGTLESV